MPARTNYTEVQVVIQTVYQTPLKTKAEVPNLAAMYSIVEIEKKIPRIFCQNQIPWKKSVLPPLSTIAKKISIKDNILNTAQV